MLSSINSKSKTTSGHNMTRCEHKLQDMKLGRNSPSKTENKSVLPFRSTTFSTRFKKAACAGIGVLHDRSISKCVLEPLEVLRKPDSVRYSVDNDLKKNGYKSVPLCNLNNLQLRFLCPSDLEEVRALCRDWFPIDYPYTWYEDITSDPRFYSLAAVYEGVIVGLIVAEIKPYSKLNKEDKNILSSCFGKSTSVAYMLSLGVSERHRQNGIASLLLDNLVSHLTAPENRDCKALFLHVLTTNKPAIRFYEHRNFRLHSFLPYYYSIKGKSKDGFTYVLYLNGGHPPWGLYDYLKHYSHVVFRGDICSMEHVCTGWDLVAKKREYFVTPKCFGKVARFFPMISTYNRPVVRKIWLVVWVRSALVWVMPGLRRSAVENTALVSQYSWATK